MLKKILTLIFILCLNSFAQSYNIYLIKYSNFDKYPNVTINEIIDAIFDNVKWEDIEGIDGNKYVNMITDTPSQKFILQFRIINNDWYINAAELNDEPYNISNIEEELYNLYQKNMNKKNQNNNTQNLNLTDSQFINLVKDNYFSSHRDVKIGDIMKTIFDNVKWEDYIKKEYLGFYNIKQNEIEIIKNETLMNIDDISKVRIITGIWNHNDEKCFHIDSDFYRLKKIISNDMFDALGIIHDQSIGLLDEIITDKLKKILEPENV